MAVAFNCFKSFENGESFPFSFPASILGEAALFFPFSFIWSSDILDRFSVSCSFVSVIYGVLSRLSGLLAPPVPAVRRLESFP